ncbi:MAG: VWA domain-containing protein [Clostridiales Family XIII bacterium]|nr:VWA domain-containing protein [Clostridiales Family XIII bacterium]
MDGRSTTPPQADNKSLSEIITSVCMINGLSGAEVKAESGEESFSKATASGVEIGIDLDRVKEMHVNSPDGPSGTPLDVLLIYTVSHEIKHAKDYIEHQFRLRSSQTPESEFFDDMIDNAVIDHQNRRIPFFRIWMDRIYRGYFPHSLEGYPLHVQFMQALRLTLAESSPDILADPAAISEIDDLRAKPLDGRVYDVLEILADPATTLKERRALAEKYVKPAYERLFALDMQAEGEERQEGGSMGEDGGDRQTPSEDGEMEEGVNEEKDVYSELADILDLDSGQEDGNEDSLSQQIADSFREKKLSEQQALALQQISMDEEETEESNEKRRIEAGRIAAELTLKTGEAEDYFDALKRNSKTIDEVSEVMLEITAPEEEILSPRYKARRADRGRRIHPNAALEFFIQSETGRPQKIWQPVERKSARQGIEFGGLDFQLLLDVSSSMQGDSAQCAADTALCLLEGLDLAKYKAETEGASYKKPDVRAGLQVFGADAVEIATLTNSVTPKQKGRAFVNLRYPASGSTLITKALRNVKDAAEKSGRDTIVLIVSDGAFGDTAQASDLVASLPANVFMNHINIGTSSAPSITKNFEALSSPSALPEKLYNLLREYRERQKRELNEYSE